MRKAAILFVKLSALLAVVGIPYLYLLYGWIQKYDFDYCKATYAAHSLIVGDSRTRKGVAPEVLRKELGLQGKVLNLAFNGVNSPYGEHYYKLIRRKVAKGPAGGLFVVTVDPGSVMDYRGAYGQREADFRFYKLWFVNMDPNIEYLIRNVSGEYSLATELLGGGGRERMNERFYPDGWVERLPSKRAFKKDISEMRVNERHPIRSPKREGYLEKTVAYLKQFGQVVIVRLPVSGEMLEEEDRIYPGFNRFVEGIAKKHGAPYFDFSGEGADYVFYDGHHHLDGPSARAFSKALAERIAGRGPALVPRPGKKWARYRPPAG